MELGGLAQLLTFLVLAIALVFAIIQAREAGRARKLQATKAVLDEIGNDDVRRARSWVLDKLPGPGQLDISKLSEGDRWTALRVAVALDRVGYMVRQGLIPKDALFNWQRDEIEQLWTKLRPIVMDVRGKRPHYCAQFQWLAEVWFRDMKGTKGGDAA